MKRGQSTIEKATVMRDYVSMVRKGTMKDCCLQFRSKGLSTWVECDYKPGEEPVWNWEKFDYRVVPDTRLDA